MTQDHDQPTGHTPRPGRKKYAVARVVVLAAIAIVALLNPKFDAWLNDHPAPRGVDAERDDRIGAAAKHSPPAAQSERSQSGPAAEITGTVPRASSRLANPDPPGKLTLVRGTRDEFRSTAGLLYVRGSVDGHRLKHVLQHAQDDLTKPVHGVFTGNRDQILAWIDRAYLKAQHSDQGVQVESQGDRMVYTVDLEEKIGYVGGHAGKRRGNPDCRCLKLVVEENARVVTSYPVQVM